MADELLFLIFCGLEFRVSFEQLTIREILCATCDSSRIQILSYTSNTGYQNLLLYLIGIWNKGKIFSCKNDIRHENLEVSIHSIPIWKIITSLKSGWWDRTFVLIFVAKNFIKICHKLLHLHNLFHHVVDINSNQTVEMARYINQSNQCLQHFCVHF